MKRKAASKRRPGPAFMPCCSCTNGWTAELKYERGELISRMVRCSCWLQHQQKIADLEKAAS